MNIVLFFCFLVLYSISLTFADEILGCGGFIKSHVLIDFTKIEVKLFTKQGILKERTNCAPNNGYYFIPLYDKGDYVLQLEPPPGWSFKPSKVNLAVDGATDLCSQGKDINFIFQGFGITGKVESLGLTEGGPNEVTVTLQTGSVNRETLTNQGNFFFTPVYPGEYTLTISHPKWHILKNSITVQVAEGNTELPIGSLVIGGYDVTGYIKSEKQPVKAAQIVLFEDENNKGVSQITACNKTLLPNLKFNSRQLCHTSSNGKGLYVFPAVPPGNYFIIPYFERQNIHFTPDKITFSVKHDSVVLEDTFEIIGFSISGKVKISDKGGAISGANIFLNGTEVGTTKHDGSYVLEKIKANTYKIKVEADELQFEEQTIKIDPNTPSLPDIKPSAYQVCGIVLNENPQLVEISQINSSNIKTTLSKKGTGNFCEYLAPGKYQIKVIVSDAEKATGIQFFPLSHVIEVSSSPLSGITFSQLKSTITGTVKCIQPTNCLFLKVVLHPTANSEEMGLHDIIADLKDSTYTFSNVRPGTYEVFLSQNKLCWKQEKISITVSSAKEVVPAFEQIGYYVVFISSHDTQCYYKSVTDQKSKNVIKIPKGKFSYCLDNPGNYEFIVDSCHTYSTEKYLFNTDAEKNEIYLNAIKHRFTIGIEAAEDIGTVTMTINLGRTKTEEGPLIYKDGKYIVQLYLAPSETAILVPHSNVFYFNPPILSISGGTDCTDLGSIFKAVKGKVFKGKVIPPLSGVLITVETENSEALMDETDENGLYKFPPLDDTKEYKISAKKSAYVLTGPDDEGTFFAHKLAEIVVEVTDKETNAPLQGTLLSLSGGDSYRSNLQTGENGKIKFHSLSPSDYFLKPMMKEYVFEPSSKIINVKEGAIVNVQLKGKRVAYSAFGQISSLNAEPEEGMIVVATGLGNCSHISEEATSEANGNFRIRGLYSHCSYMIQVGGNFENKKSIEQAIPASLNISVQGEDVSNLRFIVVHATANTDVLLKLYTEIPDHYKLLQVKLFRDSSPSTLLHTMKIDSSHLKITKENNPGMLLQLPSIPMDHKTYSIQLESVTGPGVRNKATYFHFASDKAFVYGELEYVIKTISSEQQIKQTSIWTLVVIFGAILALYNIDLIVGLLKESLSKYEFFNFIPKYKSANSQPHYTIDKNEIEQIVQNINAVKKKPKVRKI